MASEEGTEKVSFIEGMADKMGSYTTNSDVKQVFAVMSNEVLKFLRGKKIYVYLVLLALFLSLDILLPLFLEVDGEVMTLTDDGAEIARGVLNDLSLALLIMATLFSASSISSEFEERTALILLTKPIRRTTIIMGKFMASVFVGVVTLVFYYILAIAFYLISGTAPTGDLFAGFVMYIFMILMVVAVATLVSAFAKKSSTSAVLTLFVLLVFPLILEAILASRGFDTWFLLGSLRTSAAAVINGGGEPFRDAIAMVVWTVATLAGSVALFQKRQF